MVMRQISKKELSFTVFHFQSKMKESKNSFYFSLFWFLFWVFYFSIISFINIDANNENYIFLTFITVELVFILFLLFKTITTLFLKDFDITLRYFILLLFNLFIFFIPVLILSSFNYLTFQS